MFTGIVQDIGRVIQAQRKGTGLHLKVESCLVEQMRVDDSVAINGVCQTVVSKSASYFEVEAVEETLKKTNFELIKQGDEIHLELAATPSTFLGGHLVQGHVNGVGQIVKIIKKGENREVFIKLENSLLRYVVKEGSIAIDGVSLTVADVDRESNEVMISLIPHTSSVTRLLKKDKNYKFNIEVDVLAKYVENLLFYSKQDQPKHESSRITYEWLQSKGF